jgi:DNA (cytosine-5)-methyltransferase 1
VGFHDAGFDCLLAVDWDQRAVDCYNANFPRRRGRSTGVRADLSHITSRQAVYQFLEANGVYERCCDAIVGGPPCQSFSSVGITKVAALMRADDRVRDAWAQIARTRTMLFEAYALFVEALAPRWILFENVPTIRSHETYPLIMERFENLHRPDGTPLRYNLFPENYWASDYGVPQRRRRFIMVGYREDLGIATWQRPLKKAGPVVAHAIGDLPSVKAGQRVDTLPYPQQQLSEYQSLMRHGLTEPHVDLVTAHICRSHNHDDVELFGRMVPGARFSDDAVQEAIDAVNVDHKLKKYSTEKFQDKLHKLHPEKHAWTVTAHLQKDCYKFIHFRDARTVTVREAARLQSFPDRFTLPAVMGVGFRVVGNAIPPLLAEAFAKSFSRSDQRIGSADDRARALVPDRVWNQLEPLAQCEFPRKPRGPAPVSVRIVVAAGVLRAYGGWSRQEVGAYFGYHANTLSGKLQRVMQCGLWDLAQRLLAGEGVIRGDELELPFDFGEGQMAAD